MRSGGDADRAKDYSSQECVDVSIDGLAVLNHGRG
jgi:hypothetical protein